MATKTFKVALSLDNPRIIQSGINVRSFDKQSIKISIELTKNSQVYQIPTGAQIKISLLKLARQEQKIILDVPFTSADSIDWVVPDYLDGYQGEVRVGVYLIVGTENIDVGYFNITSSVSDIDNAAEEFTESVLQGWAIEDLTALLPQFQAVLDETTGKDVISAPEIILARGGEQTLGERLDSEKAEVTAQLQQTEQELTTQINLTDERVTTEVDNLNTKLSNTLTGTPKIVANTVSTLPAIGDAEKIALVLENRHLYYDNGSTWVDVGLYQEATLGPEFNFRGVEIGGDANLATDSGLYFMTATSANLPVATSIMIDTQRFGSRFIQIARRFDNPTISWVRGGDLTNISNLSWRTDIGANSILTSHIAPKAINNTLLADNSVGANNLMEGYDYIGFYFGTDKDANNLTKSGLYYVAASVLNLPKRNYFGLEAVSVLIKVEKYNTRIIQTARPINYPNEVYYRYTDGSFEGVPWINQQRESKPLFGKNVILMGDSLTDKGKQHLTIWEKTGANVDKIGIGGTTMSNHGNSADYSKLSFYALAKAISTGDYTEQETAVANIYTASSGLTDLNAWLTKFKAIDWNTVNYILVRYGTNDHAMNNVIGAIAPTNLDTSTYIGAFNQGAKDILTAYPHLRIFVATPLWRYSSNIGSGGDSDITPNNNGDLLLDFVNALQEASSNNHLPFHDYYRNSGINPYTDAHYLSDQTHLNDAGSILIGEIDSNFLTSC